VTAAQALAAATTTAVLALVWFGIDGRGLPVVAGCVAIILAALGGWEHLGRGRA
jgi:hypothetical protein